MRDTLADQSVLIIVDGMRPDALQQTPTPVLDGLIGGGACTLSAKTVSPSITLPCHASLFLSTPPQVHGVFTNTWRTPTPPIPGIVEVLAESARKAAFFYNWEELRDLSRPGMLAASIYPCRGDDMACDAQVAQAAASWLSRNRFSFAFVYLGHVDVAGHAHGWMSREYLTAVEHADRCIGIVLDALPRSAFVVVASDHGGHAKGHGTDCDEDLTIPVVLSGPGVPAGRGIDEDVSIIDIAPTILSRLGVPRPPGWFGSPIPF